ncbi:cytochrome c oxidase subunit 6a, mitochondrial-like [Canna indica]|uniref:Cytochrome c oxidase subunit 6a, mitochondrial-like n=1 Tax=Canna indica TaxID=4628 RepID=A0AAQ3JR54_9LILI|nr:cytochrome c oxidase subunit 6a, mitochondrial-like [Canna indica]
MAASMARSGLRSASMLLRRGANSKAAAPTKRSFSASAQDDARETAKWEKITYAGIVTCTILAIYNLSKGHPHHEENPPYSYLHIRNKEFPWGPDGLFETKHHADH